MTTLDVSGYFQGFHLNQVVYSYGQRCPRWWDRIVWWKQPRLVVVAIDVAAGKIVLAPLRWSWRRWRWELRPVEIWGHA